MFTSIKTALSKNSIHIIIVVTRLSIVLRLTFREYILYIYFTWLNCFIYRLDFLILSSKFDFLWTKTERILTSKVWPEAIVVVLEEVVQQYRDVTDGLVVVTDKTSELGPFRKGVIWEGKVQEYSFLANKWTLPLDGNKFIHCRSLVGPNLTHRHCASCQGNQVKISLWVTIY